MRTILLLCFFSAWGTLDAIACSCVYIPSFCETVSFAGPISANQLIVRGRIEDVNAEMMRVRVLELLNGDFAGSQLTVRGGNGANCIASTSHFSPGQEYVMSFGQAYEGTFALSECGVSWLRVEGNNVVGAVAPGIQSLPVTELMKAMGCEGLGRALNVLQVAPTLTSEAFRIFSESPVENVDVTLHDMAGRLIFEEKQHAFAPGSALEIPVGMYAAGCYVITLRKAGRHRAVKVIIA